MFRLSLKSLFPLVPLQTIIDLITHRERERERERERTQTDRHTHTGVCVRVRIVCACVCECVRVCARARVAPQRACLRIFEWGTVAGKSPIQGLEFMALESMA